MVGRNNIPLKLLVTTATILSLLAIFKPHKHITLPTLPKNITTSILNPLEPNDFSTYEKNLAAHLKNHPIENGGNIVNETKLAKLPENYKIDVEGLDLPVLVRVVENLGNKILLLERKFLKYKKWEWVYDLGIYDSYHEFSQTYTDSLLQVIYQNIGTTNKYYVEFGTENGLQTNTRYLREKRGWMGLLMDGGYADTTINLRTELITKSNIMGLFKKYQVPQEFDLLSLDIDYNTYWVWKAINHKIYRPRVIVLEYNADWSTSFDSEMVATKDCERCVWDGSVYQGANARALWKLGRDHGYTLVYMENTHVNLYFIRTDLIGDQRVADELFPMKRVFRWGKLGQFVASKKKPVKVNGLED
ncbi:hypothetical protein HK098_005286 [Nowakowskiella sp. JEL0407]|nr:hypothetical protein HK098_005286 [Nowakowskiella sp. JEL0407]